jgi:GNAT superfamily N-acetyltransferase
MTWKPKATIGREVFDWASQVCQYDRRGEPGFTEEVHPLNGATVHCLLWRDQDGLLRGILNYYPDDVPGERITHRGVTFRMGGEKAGNANIWVDPNHRGKGIGTMLAREAIARYRIDITQQRFTAAGAALAEKLMREGVLG